MTLLHRIEAINPDQPDALWYLGLAAANDRHGDEARHYWQRLMPLLPAGSEQSKKVVLALQNLPEK
jgi:cytochrome c-type biogenesis protein CcmH